MIQTPALSLRCLLVAVLSVLALPAAAQEYGRIEDIQAQAPGYFFFARPGDPVVSVTAVGAIGANGRFVLSQGTTVTDLLALAGGTTPDRAGRASVRLYRDGGRVLDTDARALYGEDAASLVLRDGDVVEVVGLVSSVPGFYVHTEPDVAPMAVTASGAFRAAGRYLLDPGASVGDLVALAGGLASGERDADVDVEATVRLYRAGDVAFESPLARLYAGDTPPLQTGDVVDLDVVLERREPFTWRDGLAILTSVAAVILTVDRVLE